MAASDGVITYSFNDHGLNHVEPLSDEMWYLPSKNPLTADTEQGLWIDKIFSFVDSITGVTFQRSRNQRGEIHLSFVPTATCKRMKGSMGDCLHEVINTEDDGGRGFSNGYAQMFSFHNREQYGGTSDIRSIQIALLESLGITPPEGQVDTKGYTIDDTILSFNKSPTGSRGASFFLTADDQEALVSLLGTAPFESKRKKKTHRQKYKEALMIGQDGVMDTFKITSKGMILMEDEGTQFDDVGVIVNNYYAANIANFNPYEGDKIKIHRSLLDPKSPIFKKSKKLAKNYKKIPLSFMHVWDDSGNYKDGANVYYNDAGKIYIDTNGTKHGLTTPENKAGWNSQLAAFVDVVGPSTDSFSEDWVSFFG